LIELINGGLMTDNVYVRGYTWQDYSKYYIPDIKQLLGVNDATANMLGRRSFEKFASSDLNLNQKYHAILLYSISLGIIDKSLNITNTIDNKMLANKLKVKVYEKIVQFVSSDRFKTSQNFGMLLTTFFNPRGLDYPSFSQALLESGMSYIMYGNDFKILLENIKTKESYTLRGIIPYKLYDLPTAENVISAIKDVFGIEIKQGSKLYNKINMYLDYLWLDKMLPQTKKDQVEETAAFMCTSIGKFTEDIIKLEEDIKNHTRIPKELLNLVKEHLISITDAAYFSKFYPHKKVNLENEIGILLDKNINETRKDIEGQLVSQAPSVSSVLSSLNDKDFLDVAKEFNELSKEMVNTDPKALMFLSFVKYLFGDEEYKEAQQMVNENPSLSLDISYLLNNINTTFSDITAVNDTTQSLLKNSPEERIQRTYDQVSKTVLRFCFSVMMDPDISNRYVKYIKVWKQINEKVLKPYLKNPNVNQKLESLVRANRAFWAYVAADLADYPNRSKNFGWRYNTKGPDCYDFSSCITSLADSFLYSLYNGDESVSHINELSNVNKFWAYMNKRRNWKNQSASQYIDAYHIRGIEISKNEHGDLSIADSEIGNYLFWYQSPISKSHNHHSLLSVDENGKIIIVDFGGGGGDIMKDVINIYKCDKGFICAKVENRRYPVHVGKEGQEINKKTRGISAYIRLNKVADNLSINPAKR